jgi:protein-disulfide isomerase
VPVSQSEKNKPVDSFTPGDWVTGEATASVKLIEYSDFQCPSCAKASGMLTELLKQDAGKIALVYRNFPLREIHPQANLAAQAAEAAGKQGKFWEMHDKLFESQISWAENRGAKDIFVSYAKDLGLDLNQFKKDLNAKEVRGLVQADYLSGLEQGISSTPTFFVNGKMMPNPGSITEFAKLIDLSLEEATASKTLK